MPTEPLVEITAVRLHELDKSVVAGCSIGRPKPGVADPRYAGTFTFDLMGWVVGTQTPARRVSVAHDGTALCEVPLTAARPDVTALFPDAAGARDPGFYACLSALPLPREFELHVSAVLGEGAQARHVPLGTVSGRRAALDPPPRHRFRPLMVTGFSRTGSNLFLGVLGGHPEVIAYRPFHFESRIAHYWADVLRELVEPGGYRRQVMPLGVPGRGWWLGDRTPMPWPYHDAELELEMGGAAPARFVAMCRERIESVCERLAVVCDRPHGVFLAEKQLPGTAPTMLWDLYPDAREVFLVRDFRDMVASVIAANRKWGGAPKFGRHLVTGDVEHVGQFRPWVADLLASFARRGEQAHLVRYEDLIRRPRDTVAALVAYLGVDGSRQSVASMVDALQPADPESDWYRTTVTAEASIGRWQRDLSPPVLAACEDVFAPALERFGYSGLDAGAI
jgi:hypothetical protein